jgi:hypothetical protein
MTDRELKLIKRNGHNGAHSCQGQPAVTLTPAEAEEGAYFKELAAARAARQAMLQRIMAELEELDEMSSAA